MDLTRTKEGQKGTKSELKIDFYKIVNIQITVKTKLMIDFLSLFVLLTVTLVKAKGSISVSVVPVFLVVISEFLHG